ncbi:molecular chaperone HtpG [Simkania negevensis]|uniref:Molecular chaperone HtpG n=1 Tax=Simkania negevensis TaxID=83561 RepID=A0ABS3ATG8_9BACT|nr:molecular chaperone HtpG [Simkania negevensis]
MEGTLTIHSENILPIIKKWLYSERDIFVRELVSNACDAVTKLALLKDQGVVSLKEDAVFKVDVAIDKENKTITFSDTGIGMDAGEVEKYIAQIAFSGAQDFAEKYQSNNSEEQFIGHFGLGFFSSYMVADNVEIQTLSYKEDAQPVRWLCDGSSQYRLEEGKRTEHGTDVILHINEDSKEFLDHARLQQLLSHYCSFISSPIFLNGNQINVKEPLWLKPATECTREEYIDFYRQLYPFEEEPLFWVHLSVDYPFHLKGILYFPKTNKDFDPNKSCVKLYCNRVFVSDNCKDLIPPYLAMLKGAIDSPDIPLNVSRSYLQMDRTVRTLATHISKKVSDRLTALYRSEKESFISWWPDIEVIVKLGILQDEKFYERVKGVLLWLTTEGEWTTLEEYLERNRKKTSGKVFYTTGDKQVGHVLDVYKEKEIEVLCSTTPIDTALMGFLESKLTQTKFQRIDGAIEESILDASKEKNLLDADGRSESARIADMVRKMLDIKDLDVSAKSLATKSLPGFLMIDEEQRRMRDYLAMREVRGGEASMFPAKKTFVVNTNSPLIESVYALHTKDPELAKELIVEAYQLALLSQKEIQPHDLNALITRTHQLLEKLAAQSL